MNIKYICYQYTHRYNNYPIFTPNYNYSSLLIYLMQLVENYKIQINSEPQQKQIVYYNLSETM